MSWFILAAGLFIFGFLFGADKHHDWRDMVGPSMMLAGIMVIWQNGPFWLVVAASVILILKLITR